MDEWMDGWMDGTGESAEAALVALHAHGGDAWGGLKSIAPFLPRWSLQGWLLAIAIGICSSLSGAGLDYGVQGLSSLRFGLCEGSPWVTFRHCPEASLSGFLVYAFAPAAAGSGIPEVKTILNGFVMSDVVSLRTLLVKIPGLMLSVAAGMSLGKEGPLVHVVSSFFPSRTLIRAFTAAVAAAIVLSVINTTNTKGLTLFSVEYSTASHPLEQPRLFLGREIRYLVFAALGVVGGLTGAAFNALLLGSTWEVLAMEAYGGRWNVDPYQFWFRLGVICIAIITLFTSYPLVMTRVLSSDTIHALFEACDAGSGRQLRGHLGLCTADDKYAEASAETILTFGVPCPAGLFVPSLFTGAALGRLVGVLMQVCRVTISLVAIMLELTGGMTYIVPFMIAVPHPNRIMGGLEQRREDEVEDSIANLKPARALRGIYDLYIVLKGYPFLQEELDVTFMERCCDIMDTGITKLDVSLQPTMSDLLWLITNFEFRGFPVVSGDSSWTEF
ncbi:H(+)/Cl(-) exchange transporter 5 [Symbiodinium microadriaticum]|uniref:H(+)/Cl(-) exchange transporter 5 n=1 Tax=Symbiodinium microadriaticum TaxID=2951 RepID=A0A1Q9CE49_SYMMI|nr:H(+)/Cl(-) exchange transporter 5 [Symbiodinium microadriaticum]